MQTINKICELCSSRIYFGQVTRSIGDDDLKPAVTAEPEITKTVLSAEDEYLVWSIVLSRIYYLYELIVYTSVLENCPTMW